ncbi:MAG: FAD-binding oxidoreductase [Alphaproteobacteria bacterium]|nr:FAD-binding oxidoreductase [Alphaproteobacteria bacterium]
MSRDFDIIVIGAGIAGASVAAHLAETRRVAILEMEERPGYHTTGRSASTYEPNYGPAPIRALTRASRKAFDQGHYLTPRETLFLMAEGQDDSFAALMAAQQGMLEIAVSAALGKHPLLRADYARRAVLDPATADIDVDLLHQTFLRQFKSRGGVLHCAKGVIALAHEGGWTVTAGGETFRAEVIVNAAGAWGDRVAELAGLTPIGLQPKRRSIAVVPGPDGHKVMDWPLIGDVGETWYCKPQGGKLIVSPADATPVDPHDAYADDMALAEGIDRFQQAVTFEVTRVDHTWGGLRSFAPDGTPVVGFDPQAEGFFWLIGQGGYGIQTSPALSHLAAAMVKGEAVPGYIADEGLVARDLSPARFAQ